MLTLVRRGTLLFWFALLSQCATLRASSANVQLTIVATNDVHGWVLEQTVTTKGGVLRYGGLANFASYVKVLRERKPGGIILLDAGDMFQGTLISNMAEGSPVIDAYNALGYDAACVGNHEFDFGPVGPAPYVQGSGEDPRGALRARIAQAKFPILAANIRDTATNNRPDWLTNDGTFIIERRGIKVGLFGLLTPQTPNVTFPANVEGLTFEPLVPTAEAASRSLRARGAEVVIALVHLTGHCQSPTNLASCDAETSELFQLAKSLPQGTVDLIVSGHGHTGIAQAVNGIPILQSYAYGRSFATVDLEFDTRTRRIISESTRMRTGIEICGNVDLTTGSCSPRLIGDAETTLAQPKFLGAPITPDPSIDRILSSADKSVYELEHTKLGVEAPKPLTRKREKQGALGSIFADGMREAAGADIAMMNSGGLRTNLPAGELTYGELFKVFPFDNRIAVIELKGSQLLPFFQMAYRFPGNVPQISGAELRLLQCGSVLNVLSAKVGDSPISPEAYYRVAIPDFLAQGGDGFKKFMQSLPPERVDYGTTRKRPLRDEVLTVWRLAKRPLIDPPGERLIFEDERQCQSGIPRRI